MTSLTIPVRVCLLLLSLISAAIAARAAGAVEFSSPPPTFEWVCYECHGDGINKGSFALDELLAHGTNSADRGTWLKVWKTVRHEFMPPASALEGMTLAERREVARWVEQAVFAVDPQHADPGVVTIRRLNREEYQHTVNDLFGTELSLRDQLLPDDSAYGFDNIGDAQTLSPALFNQYLNVAEWIVQQVVVTTGRPLPRIDFEALERKPGGGASRKALVAKEGTLEKRFPVELGYDGRYRLDLRFMIGGWQDYGGDAKLTLTIDDKLVGERKVPVGGEMSEKNSWDFIATKGPHLLVFHTAVEEKAKLTAGSESAEGNGTVTQAARPSGVKVDPEQTARRAEERRLFEEEFGPQDSASRDRRPADTAPQLKFLQLNVAVVGPLDAGIVGEYPAAHRALFFRGEAPKEPNPRRAYARDILRRFTDRAFHRPVDEPTLGRLTDLALRDENFERGVGAALMAVLVSPRFLYREEPQPEPDNPRASHPLDDYELASRLSYLLWLSVPDDELNRLAAAGRLHGNLPAQVNRMLADPKSERFFRDFTGQWLRTRNVLMTAITPGSVATRLDPLREAMKTETDLFFDYIARNDRDLLELLTANYTFLNEPLAKWYGIQGVTGEDMRKIDLPPGSHRGGLLTQGSVLVSTSNPNRTSPVKRGVFVLENILAAPPPPPPPAVPALEDSNHKAGDLKTLRAQLAAHRADRSCAACHAHFDPIGLALENFSYTGRWREQDHGEPVDAHGEMVTGEPFKDFVEMRGLLAARKDKFYRCVTEKLLTYALGRGLEPYDAPTVDAITDRLIKEGGKFSTLLLAIVESPAFQMRRGEGERVPPAAL